MTERAIGEDEWDLVEEISRNGSDGPTHPSSQAQRMENSRDSNSNSDPITTEDNLSDRYEEQYDNEDEEYDEEEEVDEPVSHPVIAPAALGLNFSYRDALLMNKRPSTTAQASSSSTPSSKRQQKTWKPIIKIEKVVPPKPIAYSSYYVPNPEGKLIPDESAACLLRCHTSYVCL
jgi:hypothetical protein